MKSPFKFLDSYTKDDRDIFFGRDKEIEELYQKVFESKLMLVYGVSGTGKSSLIHCGLANKFHETDWLPLVIRRGDNMIKSMADVINGVSITPQHSKFVNPADFLKGVRSLYLDHYKPVFFIFDQFEELFIFGNKEERTEFIQIVKSLIESDLQCRLLFVMREEYMAGITEFEKFIPTFFSNRVRIEKMSHGNAIEAIMGPCKAFDINIEEGFAETLIEKLSPGSAEVELTYLQVFLDKIYRLASENIEKENPQVSFTVSFLNAVGNVSDLLGSFLDDQLSLLGNQETGLSILKALVSEQGTKRQMSPEEISDHSLTFGKPLEKLVLMDLIQTFINLRILCEKDENGKIELRHDALAKKIFEKFTLVEKEILEVRKFVDNSFYTYEKRGILLNQQDLDYLATYENRLKLPQNLENFVTQSRDKIHNQRKALSRITRISALIFILILAAIGRFTYENSTYSNEKEMIGSILLQSDSRPFKSLTNAYRIWQKYNSSTVLRKIILQNFQKILSFKPDSASPVFLLQEHLKPLTLEASVANISMSTGGKFIFGWMENQRVFIWDTVTRKINYFDADGELTHLELSERDSLLAMVYSDNKGVVCDFSGSIRYTFETTLNEITNERLIRFFPSGSNQFVAVKDSIARIYGKNGEVQFELKGHSGRINSIDISPDSRFIASASDDKRIYIWNYNQDANQFSVYDSLIGHKDTVWSCEFNSTGKYILSASADSTIRIWDLNGNQINPWLHFAVNDPDDRYRLNKGEYDEDSNNPLFSSYYGKNCNASFSPDEMSIIATGYTYPIDTTGYAKPIYNKALFYDGKSKFYKLYYTPFSDFAHTETDTIKPELFHNITVSPLGDAAAVKNDTTNRTDLIANDGLRLITLEGEFIMYSNDGKEIFWANENKIYSLPVTPDEIIDLLNKYKISEFIKSPDGIIIGL